MEGPEYPFRQPLPGHLIEFGGAPSSLQGGCPESETVSRLTVSLGPAREWGRSLRSVSEGVNTLETLQ